MSFILRDDGSRVEVHGNTKGAINELIATAWLMKEGYDVFRNQSPRGRADLVATKWDDGGWIPVDVKSEGFDLDGFAPMHEEQRDTVMKYEDSNLRYIVVMDNGNCYWLHEIEQQRRAAIQTTHWVDPSTGQRFLHPRNDMSEKEWSFFAFWILKHHRDKLTQPQIDFLIGTQTHNIGRSKKMVSERGKDWLRKIHRYIYRKITGTDPDTGEATAANDNADAAVAA